MATQSQPQESGVQLPGGTQTGPIVRTIQATVLDQGVPTTVQIQVIAVADESGNPLLWNDQADIRREILDELRAIRLGIEHLLNDGNMLQTDLLDDARNLGQPDPDAAGLN